MWKVNRLKLMTLDEFAAILEVARNDKFLFPLEIIEEFNWIASPASAGEIDQVQRALDVQLPEDYTTFLKKYGGGVFGQVDIFTVDVSHNSYILIDQPRFAEGREFIAVSPNGCGDYYGYRVVDGKCQDKVMFWDHEIGGLIEPTEFNDIFEFIVRNGFYPDYL